MPYRFQINSSIVTKVNERNEWFAIFHVYQSPQFLSKVWHNLPFRLQPVFNWWSCTIYIKKKSIHFKLSFLSRKQKFAFFSCLSGVITPVKIKDNPPLSYSACIIQIIMYHINFHVICPLKPKLVRKTINLQFLRLSGIITQINRISSIFELHLHYTNSCVSY